MLPFTADAVYRYTEYLLHLVGLGLLGTWLLHPRLQRWRQAPPRPPRWDFPPVDTGLIGAGIVLAALFGPLLLTVIGRALGLAATSHWLTLLSLVGSHGAALLAIFVFARPGALPPVQARPRRPLHEDCVWGAALFCTALPLVSASALVSVKAVQALGYPVQAQPIAELFARADSPLLLIMLTVLSISLVPLNEELFFRAGLFRAVRARVPLGVALLASGMVFAAFHLSVVYFLPLTVLGALLAYAYEKSGSLLVPIVAHGLFNLNSIVGIVSGLNDLP